MKIIVESDDLSMVAEAVKALPVSGDFNAADRWVGCVIALQNIIVNSEPFKESEVVDDGRQTD